MDLKVDFQFLKKMVFTIAIIWCLLHNIYKNVNGRVFYSLSIAYIFNLLT